jgi:hypothetical protein
MRLDASQSPGTEYDRRHLYELDAVQQPFASTEGKYHLLQLVVRLNRDELYALFFVIPGSAGRQVLRGLTDLAQRLLRAVPSDRLKMRRSVPPSYLAEEFRDLSSHGVGIPSRNARHAAFKADLRQVRTVQGWLLCPP